MRVGRNELCPCGSGKKFKSCCEGKERTSSRGLMLLLLAIGAVVIIGVGSFIASSRNAKAPVAGAVSARGPRANQPQPGPAPPGKVWSTEHGHWHDVNPNAAAANATQTAAPTTPQPQPPGPVPAGKVWSTEHGHWHDAPK
jgi:hypothetical protein